jgi:competence protein ComFC
MRCLVCENYSFMHHICKRCQEKFLQPSLYTRELQNGTTVISFYKYPEIKKFLFTKHTDMGFYIYKLLAQLSFKKFASNFSWHNPVAAIAVDDIPKNNYSHTAILTKALSSKNIIPCYGKLRAGNPINYSGKSKAFREAHPRNFIFSDFKEKDVIVVDDIITTGSTLREALHTLTQHKKEPIFCLTLADVNLK